MPNVTHVFMLRFLQFPEKILERNFNSSRSDAINILLTFAIFTVEMPKSHDIYNRCDVVFVIAFHMLSSEISFHMQQQILSAISMKPILSCKIGS